MAATQRRTDPTRTKTTRRRFSQHLRARFDALKWHINRALVDRDVFGLSSGRGNSVAENVDTDRDVTPSPKQWADIPDAEAIAAFDSWLDSAMDREILEKYEGDTYLREGYLKGVKHADSGLRGADLADPDVDNVAAVLRRPVHRDGLGRIYTRTYQSLEGVTEATANQMRRELADGLARGDNPRKIARNLNDRVEKIGRTRATVVSRTEVIRAHSESSLTRYKEIAGPETTVTVRAEVLTADDDRVCEECASLEGRAFSLDEARGVIPIHPQCRCTWLPKTDT